MHDVDLLPKNPALLYKYPESGPLHLSGPGLHPKYDYPTFIGGILLITRKMYTKLDGMSNKYWGWGLEDDEFFVRMRQANIVIERPKGIRTGKSGTFRHVHITKDRPRDNAKCYNQRNATRRRDKQTGLSNTLYSVSSRRRITVDGAMINFLDIELGEYDVNNATRKQGLVRNTGSCENIDRHCTLGNFLEGLGRHAF